MPKIAPSAYSIQQPRWLALLALLSLQLGCAATRSLTPDRFEICGDVERPQQWSAAEFRAAFAVDLKDGTATSKGREITFRGVPLLKVVEQAGPIVSGDRKNAALALAVAVEGRDGYTAALSLAEIRDEYGNSPAYVVVEIDGRPPALERGPVELIVPKDRRSSRWVHGVARIRVHDLTRSR